PGPRHGRQQEQTRRDAPPRPFPCLRHHCLLSPVGCPDLKRSGPKTPTPPPRCTGPSRASVDGTPSPGVRSWRSVTVRYAGGQIDELAERVKQESGKIPRGVL